MKFSTRARYGLRMMVELTRELKDKELVHLGRVAEITGLSEKYLAQLAMPLKTAGLVIGISGKMGGYQLARPANQIKVSEVIAALIGPIGVTDCVTNPTLCLTSSFCETRMVWALVNNRIQETLDEFTLADLIDKEWVEMIRKKFGNIPNMNPDQAMLSSDKNQPKGCPTNE
jgi:Rrf2 family transcriptional regulator, cysteine metabolism repressor